MKKALIIDGNSIINRSYYGIKDMSTKNNIPTNAIYGFLNKLFNKITSIKPDYICICFDAEKKNFRHDYYQEYKGNRSSMDDNLFIQFKILKEILYYMNIKCLQRKGLEADDFLGILSKKFKENNVFSYILTGDQDSFQLVDDMSYVCYESSSKKLTGIYDEFMVKNFKGVYPKQIIDLKAIAGDSSDNIKGVKGIGNIGAVKLINEYGSLENIYENLDKIKGKKIRENLEESRETAFRDKKIITILRDLDGFKFLLKDYELKPYDFDNVLKLLNLYELSIFFKKVNLLKNDFVKKGIDIKQFKKTKYDENVNNVVLEKDKYDKVSSEVKNLTNQENMLSQVYSEHISFLDYKNNNKIPKYLFTKNNQFILNIDKKEIENKAIINYDSICISYKNDIIDFVENMNVNENYYLEILYVKNTIFEDKIDYIFIANEKRNIVISNDLVDMFFKKMKIIFKNSSLNVKGYDLNKSLLVLQRYSISYNVIFDSIIAIYVLDSNIKNQNLNNLAIDLDITKNDEIINILCLDKIEDYKKSKDKGNISKEEILEYFYKFWFINQKSFEILNKRLYDNNLNKIYYEIEIPLIKILVDMEFVGVCIDKNKLNEIANDLDINILIAEQKIYELSNKTKNSFNINSPKQLANVLFKEMKLPYPKKVKDDKYSTDKEILNKILENAKNSDDDSFKNIEIIEYILKYKECKKLRNTYVDGILKAVNKVSGKVHTHYSQILASTGRITSLEPNLQNIPVKTKMGREFRKIFITSDKVLVDGDYSQIELRVLAFLSKDKEFVRAYNNNVDIHKLTASKIFDKNIDDITEDERNIAKVVNFGIIYGMSSYGLSELLKKDYYSCKNYIDSYFKKYEGIKKYLDEEIENCIKNGYTKTFTGRKRNININNLKNKEAIRKAMNTPIQGSASDIIKIAMIKVYKKLNERNLKTKLIMQIHDELILDVKDDEIDEVIEILRDSMENGFNFNIPIKADIGYGKSWFEAKI